MRHSLRVGPQVVRVVLTVLLSGPEDKLRSRNGIPGPVDGTGVRGLGVSADLK
jgi:hypothetical protein